MSEAEPIIAAVKAAYPRLAEKFSPGALQQEAEVFLHRLQIISELRKRAVESDEN